MVPVIGTVILLAAEVFLMILVLLGPSEGFPRLAYLGPGAGWDGGRKDFEDSRRSGVSIRAHGPLGPWAQDLEN